MDQKGQHKKEVSLTQALHPVHNVFTQSCPLGRFSLASDWPARMKMQEWCH